MKPTSWSGEELVKDGFVSREFSLLVSKLECLLAALSFILVKKSFFLVPAASLSWLKRLSGRSMSLIDLKAVP